jgi:hypothetical protein
VKGVDAQPTVRVTVLKGRLEHKAEMFVEPSSVGVGLGHQPDYLATAKLLEGIGETGPQVLAVQPPSARDGSHVHSDTGAIPTFEDHTGDQLGALEEADSLSGSGNPCGVELIRYPLTDSVGVLAEALSRRLLQAHR